jgi:purine-binding chemotaxis protein CheW
VTATVEHEEIQLVTFFLNGAEYGVDVMRVREISDMAEITKAANTPDHVLGVIDLRGSILPVISLRRRFGMPDSPDPDTNCIAVTDFNGTRTGFVIDGISDVLRAKRSDIQPPHALVAQPWMEGILHVGGKMVVFVNLEHLA